MKVRNLTVAIGVASMALLASTASMAATKAEIDVSVAEALTQFHALSPANADLEKKSTGMLVFPRITKGGAGVAGEYGEGVLQVKGKTAGYYSVASASIGLTLGAAKRSQIIMFMNQETLDKFNASKGWSIGAETGVALVSMGAGGSYDSKTLQRPILGFVFGEKGLMADVSLEGSKVNKLER